jgi:hypothetical protein
MFCPAFFEIQNPINSDKPIYRPIIIRSNVDKFTIYVSSFGSLSIKKLTEYLVSLSCWLVAFLA